MLNGLLMKPETIQLLLQYGFYVLVIVVALIVIGCIKRNKKASMKPEAVKSACEKAVSYVDALLEENEKRAPSAVIASTKLAKLTVMVEEAAWLGYQIVETKKDIVMEGIAGSLDKVATSLDKETEDGYVKSAHYLSALTEAKGVLAGVVEKLNVIIAER